MQDKEDIQLAILACIGATVALGKTLASDEPWSFKKTIGRVIVGGAVGVASASILNFYPDMPDKALYGVSAVCAILGVDFITEVARKFYK